MMGGGGMFGGGAGIGTPGLGGNAPGGHVGTPGNGLPFAGIPSELAAGVEKLLQTEPDWETPEPKFSYRMKERGVTLGRMLAAHKRMLTISIVLVVIEALTLQAGPLLTQLGIDHGIAEDDWGVLLACAIGAILAVVITVIASHYRVSFTGRFSSD